MRVYQIAGLLSLLLSSHAFATEVDSFPFAEASIASLHTAIRAHQTTCEKIIRAHIDRIKRHNLTVTDSTAPINAITEINPSALTQARALDRKFMRTSKLSGPLHCIPVILKDNIDSYDTTTATGSFSMLGSQPVQDAFVTKRLRDAGAIILAKGGMDEFAYGLNGISSRNGRIGNAFNPNRNPGGSSSGVGAGISANFAVIGIGTDNSGSVRIPSAFNGIVGLRPSRGLISQHGIFPMGNLDGTAGPMTRTITDLAKVLSVISAEDKQDVKTKGVPRVKSYLSYLNKNALQDKRIAFVHKVGSNNTFKNMPAYEKKMIKNAIADFKKLGATVIDIELNDFNNDRADNQSGQIEDINHYLASFPAARRNFKDICLSNRSNTFGSKNECLKMMVDIQGHGSKTYKQVEKTIESNKNYLHTLMDKQNIDALFIPISTNGSASYNPYDVNTWTSPVSSNSGLPSIEFIAGYAPDDMPIGVELIARKFHEGELIGMAYAYEQLTGPRKTPTLPAADQKLAQLNIAQTNNLYTLLGTSTYYRLLKNRNLKVALPDVVTPEKFRVLANKQISDYKKSLLA